MTPLRSFFSWVGQQKERKICLKCISILGYVGKEENEKNKNKTGRGEIEQAGRERVCGRERKLDAARGLGKSVQEKKQSK